MDDLAAGGPLDGIGINISCTINRAFAGLFTADWGMLDSPIRPQQRDGKKLKSRAAKNVIAGEYFAHENGR